MKIKKIFNNNVILARTTTGLDEVVLGRGIAFQSKIGDPVNEAKIDRVSVADSPDTTNKYVQLLAEVPVNHLKLADKIVEEAQTELHCVFNDMTYIGIADHINYALQRYHADQSLTNSLLWEIKHIYPQEFQAALHALDTIEYYENIQMPEDEAGFIALHFVNGQENQTQNDAEVAVEIIANVTQIVERFFTIQLDQDSLNYSRFVVHLRYFIQHVLKNKASRYTQSELYHQIKKVYPEATKCVADVVHYLGNRLHTTVDKEEQAYLILHVQRLIQ